MSFEWGRGNNIYVADGQYPGVLKQTFIEIQKVAAQTFYSKVELIQCGYHTLLIVFT